MIHFLPSSVPFEHAFIPSYVPAIAELTGSSFKDHMGSIWENISSVDLSFINDTL